MQKLEKPKSFEGIRGKLRLPLDMKPCICELNREKGNASKDEIGDSFSQEYPILYWENQSVSKEEKELLARTSSTQWDEGINDQIRTVLQ
ncbi:hypothetical protein ES707_05564 [subsurface metagenome]